MKTKEIIKRAGELARPFRISKGKDFRLKDVDPNDTLEFTKEADKPRAKEVLTMGVKALAELQDKLYAQDKWAMLLIFRAVSGEERSRGKKILPPCFKKGAETTIPGSNR